MYRYLFEENCFNRIFEVNKKINLNVQKKVKDILADILKIKYEDIQVVYYKKTEKSLEFKLETEKKIGENFVFRVCVEITEFDSTYISLDTFISRTVPVNLAGPVTTEDVFSNLVQEFSKKTFYVDMMADYKLKYEELSKEIFEGLEMLFGFENVYQITTIDNKKE
ncbi:MAG: hypothetical protein DRP06_02260 [Candidatus Aenigmatarchaeota archaeon]|nr:MAG: hypothetical protein DRP06_02260 [Candidatus Aenigmarchaeota archaeon]